MRSIAKTLVSFGALIVLLSATAFAQTKTLQTITMLGGNGQPGDIDPYTEASLDGGQTWSPAYLTGGPHPFDEWFFGNQMIQGTNSWINYQQNWYSPVWASKTNPFYVKFRIRFNVPSDYEDPSMALQVRVDNAAVVKLNGTTIANINDYGSPSIPEATLDANLQIGLNEITLDMIDYGGLVAMAYRIDLSMYSAEDLSGSLVDAGPEELSVTGWEMNRGGGYVRVPHIGYHGNPVLYDYANIPSEDDPNWGPAPNPETIGFSERSNLPGYCLTSADFTYFQTYVSIPFDTEVETFNVEFSGADDGAQITIFNSAFPDGFSPPDAYIVLGGPMVTTDMSDYVVPGVNRVVITQVDDCPTGNNLYSARIVLNGAPITKVITNTAPVAVAGSDQVIECVVNEASVTLDGSGSSDADGDALTYSWTSGNVVYTGAVLTTTLGEGTHTFTLTVSDGEESSSDNVTVTVNLDKEDPVFDELSDATVIANANGGFAGTFSATATDACGGEVTITSDAPAIFPVGTTTITFTATDAAGNSLTATMDVTVERYPVLVDIKPGNDQNPVNPKNKGVLPVAVLTTPEFDATTLDVSSLLFGPNGATTAHRGHLEDVDDDGDIDLMLHFPTQSIGIGSNTTELVLTGSTNGGIPVGGSDSITQKGKRAKDMVGIVPEVVSLGQNYPNPFNPSTVISFGVPESGHVKLTVYNVSGQEVAQVVDGHMNAGIHSVKFDATKLSTGMYFYTLETAGTRIMKKMSFMK